MLLQFLTDSNTDKMQEAISWLVDGHHPPDFPQWLRHHVYWDDPLIRATDWLDNPTLYEETQPPIKRLDKALKRIIYQPEFRMSPISDDEDDATLDEHDAFDVTAGLLKLVEKRIQPYDSDSFPSERPHISLVDVPSVHDWHAWPSDPSSPISSFESIDINEPTQADSTSLEMSEAVEKHAPSTCAKPVLISNNRAKFSCYIPGCTKSFTRAANLRSHIHAHQNLRPFLCSQCNKAFRRPEELSRHTKERHNGSPKKHICGVLGEPGPRGCGQSFTRAEALRRHQRNAKPGTFCQKLPEQGEPHNLRTTPSKRMRKSSAYAVEPEESSGNLTANLVDADHEEIAEQQRSERGRTTVDTGIANIGSPGRTSPSTMQLQGSRESLTNLDLIRRDSSHFLQEKPERVAKTSSQQLKEGLENERSVPLSRDGNSYLANHFRKQTEILEEFEDLGNIPTKLDDLADAASGVHDTSGINQVAPTAPQLRFSSPSWYCTRCQMSRDDPVCYSRDCITSPKSNIFALYYWCKTCQEFRTVVMDPLTGYDEDDRRRRLCRYCRDHLSTDGYILDPQRL